MKTLPNFPQMTWFMNKNDNKNRKPQEKPRKTPKGQTHC